MPDVFPGDFNSDGVLTADDIDLLSMDVAMGSNTARFDLTDDALVNQLDRTRWVEDIAATFFGDADLNGSVEFADFLAMSASFGTMAGWADGDFDGNGEVQFSDFLALSANFGATGAASASVPEPDSMAISMAIAIYSRVAEDDVVNQHTKSDSSLDKKGISNVELRSSN